MRPARTSGAQPKKNPKGQPHGLDVRHPGEERERHKSHLKPPQLREIWRDTHTIIPTLFLGCLHRAAAARAAPAAPQTPKPAVPHSPGQVPGLFVWVRHTATGRRAKVLFFIFLNKRRREITTISQPSPAEIPQLGRPRRRLGFIVPTRFRARCPSPRCQKAQNDELGTTGSIGLCPLG